MTSLETKDKEALRIVLDFVERWNKKDAEGSVAESSRISPVTMFAGAIVDVMDAIACVGSFIYLWKKVLTYRPKS